MNMRDAKRLKPGAIVRESYHPDSMGHPIHGIVIGKNMSRNVIQPRF